MNGLSESHIVEGALALSLIYVMLALFCSTANEWVATLGHARGRHLRRAVRRLLGWALAGRFDAHPLLTGMMQGGIYPSHIPARVFSTVLLDLLSSDEPGALCFDTVCDGIAGLQDGGVRTALFALLRSTQGKPRLAQLNIETWYGDAMERVTASYQRRAHLSTLALAVVVTVGLDADTLAILRNFWPTGLPLGWTGGWTSRVMGWALTAGAVSLGAPFWFDVVRRFTRRVRHRCERHTA